MILSLALERLQRVQDDEASNLVPLPYALHASRAEVHPAKHSRIHGFRLCL